MTKLDVPALADAEWRKSSYSGGGNQCVEVAQASASVAVRDSKNPDGDHLIFGIAEWRAFLASVKRGNCDQ